MKNIVFILLLLTVGLFSCRKEKLGWDSDWVVPLVNDTLDLSHLVNDSTLSVSGPNYYVDLHRDLLDIGITDFVAIPDTSIEYVFTLWTNAWTFAPGYQFIDEVREDELVIEDVELKVIGIESSFVDLYVTNPVETKVYLTVELPGFSKDGVDFVDTYEIPPRVNGVDGLYEIAVPIDGYTADLSGANGDAFNMLRSRISVLTDPNGPSVTMTDQDVTIVRSTFRDVKLNYARGYFGNQVITDTSSFNADFFNTILGGSIDIPATSVTINIENGMKFDAEGTVNYLKNTNVNNNTVFLTGNSINNPFIVNTATGNQTNLQPSFTSINFNSGNSTIEEYIENLGTTHEIAYSLETNPFGNTSGGWNEVFKNSRLKLSVDAQMPLAMQINDLIITDTFDLSLDQDFESTHVSEGKFVLYADNAFPIAGRIKLKLLDANDNLLQTIDGSSIILSALMGELNEDGVMHSKSTVEFALSNDAIISLDNAAKIVVESTFTSPDQWGGSNIEVAIPAAAYLGVKLKADFKLKAQIK